MATYTLVFDGVAADDLALCFPPLEAAVAELEVQAAAANTNALYAAYTGTVRGTLVRLELLRARLQQINRG